MAPNRHQKRAKDGRKAEKLKIGRLQKVQTDRIFSHQTAIRTSGMARKQRTAVVFFCLNVTETSSECAKTGVNG